MFVAKPSCAGPTARYWMLIAPPWTRLSSLANPSGMTVANWPSALLTVPGGAVVVVAVPVVVAGGCELVLDEDADEEDVCSSVVLLPHPAMAEALTIRAARRLACIAVEANRSGPVGRLQSVRRAT
jgi:hypothetical protein